MKLKINVPLFLTVLLLFAGCTAANPSSSEIAVEGPALVMFYTDN